MKKDELIEALESHGIESEATNNKGREADLREGLITILSENNIEVDEESTEELLALAETLPKEEAKKAFEEETTSVNIADKCDDLIQAIRDHQESSVKPIPDVAVRKIYTKIAELKAKLLGQRGGKVREYKRKYLNA